MNLPTHYDVIVVGSGAGAMVSALRAFDNGLSVIILEKAHLVGGTSALSGGMIWVPNHGLGGLHDSREQALTYLRHVTRGEAHDDRVEAYIDFSPAMIAYLRQLNIGFDVGGVPDYEPDAPGSAVGRSLSVRTLDGKDLGKDYFRLREPLVKILGRYSPNLAVSYALAKRSRGWRWIVAKMFLRYWLDIPWRLKTPRDRYTNLGNALVGSLYRELRRRDIPVLLNTRLTKLVTEGSRVSGVECETHGTAQIIHARRAVILAAGGFEQSQRLRDRYLPVATDSDWSLTPRAGNTGDALEAALETGADTEFTEYLWWSPTMQLPSASAPNVNITHQMFFDHRHPHSVIVNRLGNRFASEGLSYDDFGKAMIVDQLNTGANTPCWMVFDARYREKFGCGGLMPNIITPDRKVPPHWWDNYVYRASTIDQLADKILVPATALNTAVADMNAFSKTGRDTQFGRGENAFDRFFGDERVKPNPCLGAIDTPPFYAIRIDLGDLGSKGGLKVNARAQVIKQNSNAFENLYAIGNCSASPFADAYPGAGGTLGPAMTFGFIAADDLARQDAAAGGPRQSQPSAAA